MRDDSEKVLQLEDVISNLELNIRWIRDNPAHQFPGWSNVETAMRDALELLKKQEPVKPHYVKSYYKDGRSRAYCGNCGIAVNIGIKNNTSKHRDFYCGYCGKKVKWD